MESFRDLPHPRCRESRSVTLFNISAHIHLTFNNTTYDMFNDFERYNLKMSF